ncbi:MAG: O-antigen ligase family protein [Pseudomonadota bacterium]
MPAKRRNLPHLLLGGLAHAGPAPNQSGIGQAENAPLQDETDRPAVQSSPEDRTRASAMAFLAVCFVGALCMPLSYTIAGIRLPIYRMVLITLFIPMLARLFSDKNNRFLAADAYVILYCAWATIALIYHHGAAAIETAGVTLVDALAAYLAGRTLITSKADMHLVLRYAFVFLVLLIPTVLVEALTGRNIILQFFSSFGDAHPNTDQGIRMGLHRVQGPFEHPILFGVFSASLFVLAALGRAFKSLFLTILFTATALMCALLSLSTGALLLVNVALILMLWRRMFIGYAHRWKLLGGCASAAYLIIDIASNRTPFHVFVSYLTFNSGSAYNRINIWIHGTAEVERYPILGIGMNDWTRPSWMSASIDNFWLVQAIRYGIPAFILLSIAIYFALRQVSQPTQLGPETASLRRAMVFALVSILFAICSVHLWNAIHSWFMFLIGAMSWIALKDQNGAAQTYSVNRD